MFETVLNRSSPPEVFLGKGVLKIYNKFPGEYSCPSVISIKSQSKTEHPCRSVIYSRTPKPKCDFNNVALQLYCNHTPA